MGENFNILKPDRHEDESRVEERNKARAVKAVQGSREWNPRFRAVWSLSRTTIGE